MAVTTRLSPEAIGTVLQDVPCRNTRLGASARRRAPGPPAGITFGAALRTSCAAFVRTRASLKPSAGGTRAGTGLDGHLEQRRAKAATGAALGAVSKEVNETPIAAGGLARGRRRLRTAVVSKRRGLQSSRKRRPSGRSGRSRTRSTKRRPSSPRYPPSRRSDRFGSASSFISHQDS